MISPMRSMKAERIILVIRLGIYNLRWLGFIDSGGTHVRSDWLTLRLSYRQLSIESKSQGRAIVVIILPSHGEAHPYNDHAEHNALYIKLVKRSNRWRRAQSHNDWGYLFKSMSYYGGCLCGKNLPHVLIWNKPSYETNIKPIRLSKTLNR